MSCNSGLDLASKFCASWNKSQPTTTASVSRRLLRGWDSRLGETFQWNKWRNDRRRSLRLRHSRRMRWSSRHPTQEHNTIDWMQKAQVCPVQVKVENIEWTQFKTQVPSPVEGKKRIIGSPIGNSSSVSSPISRPIQSKKNLLLPAQEVASVCGRPTGGSLRGLNLFLTRFFSLLFSFFLLTTAVPATCVESTDKLKWNAPANSRRPHAPTARRSCHLLLSWHLVQVQVRLYVWKIYTAKRIGPVLQPVVQSAINYVRIYQVNMAIPCQIRRDEVPYWLTLSLFFYGMYGTSFIHNFKIFGPIMFTCFGALMKWNWKGSAIPFFVLCWPEHYDEVIKVGKDKIWAKLQMTDEEEETKALAFVISLSANPANVTKLSRNKKICRNHSTHE